MRIPLSFAFAAVLLGAPAVPRAEDSYLNRRQMLAYSNMLASLQERGTVTREEAGWMKENVDVYLRTLKLRDEEHREDPAQRGNILALLDRLVCAIDPSLREADPMPVCRLP